MTRRASIRLVAAMAVVASAAQPEASALCGACHDVTLEAVLVGADGRVRQVSTIGPPQGLGFDDAAIAAALRARFTPGTRDGQARAMPARITVRFML